MITKKQVRIEVAASSCTLKKRKSMRGKKKQCLKVSWQTKEQKVRRKTWKGACEIRDELKKNTEIKFNEVRTVLKLTFVS